jgi:hypothetical protein
MYLAFKTEEFMNARRFNKNELSIRKEKNLNTKDIKLRLYSSSSNY